MRFSSAPKHVGFSNDSGEMNCFLNCALQALCNLDQIKTRLLKWELPCPPGHSCLCCEVKSIVVQYSSPRAARVLDVTKVRNELAGMYEAEGKFSLCNTADSMEALDALLQAIHRAAVREESKDCTEQQCRPTCPAHETAGLSLEECLKCSCGKKTDAIPWDNCSFSLNCYIQELLEGDNRGSIKLMMMTESRLIHYKALSTVLPCVNRLPDIYKRSLAAQVFFQCVDKRCFIKQSVRFQHLLNSPKVLAFSLVWPDRIPTQTDTLRVLSSLPDRLSLSELFEGSERTHHMLKGMILYTPGHYIAMFRDKSGSWVRYDDYAVRLIQKGADKFEMLADCLRNNLHPVAVFYEELLYRMPEDYQLAERDWLIFEKWTLENDMNREELKQLDQALAESLIESAVSSQRASTAADSHEEVKGPLQEEAKGSFTEAEGTFENAEGELLLSKEETDSMIPLLDKQQEDHKLTLEENRDPPQTDQLTDNGPLTENHAPEPIDTQPKPEISDSVELVCEICRTKIETGSKCQACTDLINEVWICPCGSKNCSSWLICQACNEPKPGETGWVCKHCTSLNVIDFNFCRTCFEDRIKTPSVFRSNTSPLTTKPSTSVCEICTQNLQIKEKKYCSRCAAEQTLALKRCNCHASKPTGLICYNCRLKLRRCTRCKLLIGAKDGCVCSNSPAQYRASLIARPGSRSGSRGSFRASLPKSSGKRS